MKKYFLHITFILGFNISIIAQTVYVTDYGCSETDATYCIQKAIDSGADKVIIPNIGKTYFARPLYTTQENQEILFEPGVVLEAKKNEFKGIRDCLFNITNTRNITLIGYGATFKMQKADYQNSAFPTCHYDFLIYYICFIFN
jgi:hypothetical protein